MQIKAFALAVLLALVPLASATQQWVIVDSDYTTIAVGCSFYEEDTGYVAGGTATVQSEILYTTDGGVSFTNEPLTGGSNGLAAWLTVDVTSDGQSGIAGGFGFIGIQSGAIKTNGGNWTSIGSELLCAYTDSKALDSETFALIGTWTDAGDLLANGVRFTTDAGNSWAETTWVPVGVDSLARYGFWINDDTGYVTGGTYPVSDAPEERIFRLNEFVRYKDGAYEVDLDIDREELGYSGLIQSVTNGGTEFTPLVNTTGEYYFSEIWCASAQECWVVASGVNSTNLLPASWIFYTSDGFNTMQTQFYGENFSLNTVDFSDPQTGFVGGAMFAPGAEFYAAFLYTTDGKTWTLSNDELKNFFCLDISVVSSTYAYCAGFSAIGLSSFASFTPNN